jgi:tRNA threonylcarbamoyl adenosine modification protein YeaZ
MNSGRLVSVKSKSQKVRKSPPLYPPLLCRREEESDPPFVSPYSVVGEKKVTPPLSPPAIAGGESVNPSLAPPRKAGEENYLLALETSGKTLSFALLDDDQLVSEVLMRLPTQNKDGLALWIQRWFQDLNITVEQLNGVAVSCGPGSFTGLRVGMSLAKGICLARNIPLWAVPTLVAMAYNVPPTDRLLCPTTVARTKECYAALFRWTEEGIKEVKSPFVADAQTLAKHLSSLKVTKLQSYKVDPLSFPPYFAGGKNSQDRKGPDLLLQGEDTLQHNKLPEVWIFGEGALGMKDDLQKLLPQHQQILTNDLFLPRASSVARLAQQMILQGVKPAEPDLEPFYLKKFPG